MYVFITYLWIYAYIKALNSYGKYFELSSGVIIESTGRYIHRYKLNTISHSRCYSKRRKTKTTKIKEFLRYYAFTLIFCKYLDF